MASSTVAPKQIMLFEEPDLPESFNLYKIKSKALTREESLLILDELVQMRPISQNTKDGGISFKLPAQKKLLADFSEGYAKNWFFQVHGVFSKCLDIRDKLLNKTELKTNTQPYKVQGCLFNFSVNQMIYDTCFAYLSPWSECLKYIKYGLEISKASPVSLIEPSGQRIPGLVEGWLYKNISGKFRKKKHFSMTQDDFVRLLIRGFEEDWLNES